MPIALRVVPWLAVIAWFPASAVLATAQQPREGVSASGLAYEGLALPSRRVVLKSSVEERVTTILAKEADVVAAGAVLVRLDDAVQQAAVRRATLQAEDETPVRFAALALEEADLRLEQAEQMFKMNAANEMEVIAERVARDQAEVRVSAAKLQRQQAEAELSIERSRLDRHAIAAPFEAVVVEVMIDEGASVTREEPILELVALDPLEAEVYVPADVFGRLELGKTYPLRAGAPVYRTLQARLDRFVPMIDPGSRTFRAVFEIDNADRSLPSGFSVELPRDAVVEAE